MNKLEQISFDQYKKIYDYYKHRWDEIELLRFVQKTFEKTNKRTRTQLFHLSSVSGLLFGILFPLTFLIKQYLNIILTSIFLSAHGVIFISFIFSEIIPLFLGARSLGIVRYGPAPSFNAINQLREIEWQESSSEERRLELDKISLEIQRSVKVLKLGEFHKTINENKKLSRILNFSLNNSRFIFLSGIILLVIVLVGHLIFENLVALGVICLIVLISISINIIYILIKFPSIPNKLAQFYETINQRFDAAKKLYMGVEEFLKNNS